MGVRGVASQTGWNAAAAQESCLLPFVSGLYRRAARTDFYMARQSTCDRARFPDSSRPDFAGALLKTRCLRRVVQGDVEMNASFGVVMDTLLSLSAVGICGLRPGATFIGIGRIFSVDRQ